MDAFEPPAKRIRLTPPPSSLPPAAAAAAAAESAPPPPPSAATVIADSTDPSPVPVTSSNSGAGAARELEAGRTSAGTAELDPVVDEASLLSPLSAIDSDVEESKQEERNQDVESIGAKTEAGPADGIREEGLSPKLDAGAAGADMHRDVDTGQVQLIQAPTPGESGDGSGTDAPEGVSAAEEVAPAPREDCARLDGITGTATPPAAQAVVSRGPAAASESTAIASAGEENTAAPPTAIGSDDSASRGVVAAPSPPPPPAEGAARVLDTGLAVTAAPQEDTVMSDAPAATSVVSASETSTLAETDPPVTAIGDSVHDSEPAAATVPNEGEASRPASGPAADSTLAEEANPSPSLSMAAPPLAPPLPATVTSTSAESSSSATQQAGSSAPTEATEATTQSSAAAARAPPSQPAAVPAPQPRPATLTSNPAARSTPAAEPAPAPASAPASAFAPAPASAPAAVPESELEPEPEDPFTVPQSEAYRAVRAASQWNSLLGWARSVRLESSPGGAERGWDFATGMYHVPRNSAAYTANVPRATPESLAASSSKKPLPALSLHATSSSLLYSQNPDVANLSDDDGPGTGGVGTPSESLFTESGRPRRSRAAMTRG